MADPESSLYISHIMGIVLDNEGVATTEVVATNRRTGETQRERTTTDKVVFFDAAGFTTGYLVDDEIEFVNVGSSVGVSIITISDATGGFQESTMDCVAAATVSANL